MIGLMFLAVALCPGIVVSSPVLLEGGPPSAWEVNSRELRMVGDSLGSRIMLLQLERQIRLNLLVGSEVENYIRETDLEVDLEEMDLILECLESLLTEIESTKESEDVAGYGMTYFSAQRDAAELTRRFRELSANYLDMDDRDELEVRIEELDLSSLNEVDEELDELIREYNARNIGITLQLMNLSEPELIEGIRTGRINASEAREQVVRAFRELDYERQREATMRYWEYAIRGRVSGRVVGDEARVFCINNCCGSEECVDNRLEVMRQAAATDPARRNFGQRTGYAEGRALVMQGDFPNDFAGPWNIPTRLFVKLGWLLWI